MERNESQSIVCGMGRPSRTIERVSGPRAARGDARSACVGGASMRKITGKIYRPRSGNLRAVVLRSRGVVLRYGVSLQLQR